MTCHIFHAIKSPIRALNTLGFPNTTRSDRFYSLAHNAFDLYFFISFEIQLRFSVQTMFRHHLKHLPCNRKSHSSIKSTRIPKCNAKRSESNSSIKSTRIPYYNARRSV
ncbi:uncharacterized protein G2W53_014503 [Senna tora]|uniref:Uncharacterized protein n=1 Tax=Senna tora TaxID=362788 RepID=A0A835C5S1_9FABA|nr:uncharacterized protein G2W53_014503 [Senna tora]